MDYQKHRLPADMGGSGKHDESIEHFRMAAMYGPLRMAGMPQIGNAKGDTNFSHIAGAPTAEAQLALAKELVAEGDITGAQAALWERSAAVFRTTYARSSMT